MRNEKKLVSAAFIRSRNQLFAVKDTSLLKNPTLNGIIPRLATFIPCLISIIPL
jgi:hypothetical protein